MIKKGICRALCGIACIMGLSGCQNILNEQPKPDDPLYAPVPPEQLEAPPISNGSLFQRDHAISLYSDHKAIRVGDLLTVKLTEANTASKASKVKQEKNTSISNTNPTIFGTTPQFNVSGAAPVADKSRLNLETTIDNENSFDSKGDADQSNSLDGYITVTVFKVLPNGNLMVRGEKWFTLTTGEEYIRLTGIVRPDDVDEDNTVASTRVANARIAYSGTGQIAESNVMGWLSRFFMGAMSLFPL